MNNIEKLYKKIVNKLEEFSIETPEDGAEQLYMKSAHDIVELKQEAQLIAFESEESDEQKESDLKSIIEDIESLYTEMRFKNEDTDESF